MSDDEELAVGIIGSRLIDLHQWLAMEEKQITSLKSDLEEMEARKANSLRQIAALDRIQKRFIDGEEA